MHRHPRRFVVGLVTLLLVLAGCGGSSSSTARAKDAPTLGPVTVFAAASLAPPFRALQRELRTRDPGLDVTFSFAGSQTLERQIEQGAPADVFAAADEVTMRAAQRAGVVGTPSVFARNRLEIVVAAGNPKHVTGLADLARPDLTVVLADPSVPAGNYARQALAKAHVTVRPKSLELDVQSTLAKVTSGEADAAIVYASDVRTAGPKVQGVTIPDAQNVVATYPIAVVKHARHAAAARAFVAAVLSTEGRAALTASGFLPAA